MTRRARRRQSGFTLIELAFTAGLASIVGITFFSIVYMQTTHFLNRLDEVDAHQNGRAGLNMLRRYVQAAGYGLAQNANAAGVVSLGTCLNSAAPQLPSGSCNNLPSDGGSDRLRAVFLQPDSEFVSSNATGSANNCLSDSLDSSSTIHTQQALVRPLLPGSLVGIGGKCADTSGPIAGSDVWVLGGDSPGANCAHRFSGTQLSSGASSLTCSGGYAPGFSFGRAVVADFYIAPDSSGKSALMLSTHPLQPARVVAFGIEDLQVRYGLDASVPADGRADAWCDDPRPSSAGGSCDLSSIPAGQTFALQEQYNRIVAVQLALRTVSDTKRPGARPSSLDPNWTAAKPVPNPQDGLRRWLVTTTINLRNNHIE